MFKNMVKKEEFETLTSKNIIYLLHTNYGKLELHFTVKKYYFFIHTNNIVMFLAQTIYNNLSQTLIIKSFIFPLRFSNISCNRNDLGKQILHPQNTSLCYV